MKRTILKLSVGVITFLLGICGVYLTWLYNQKPAKISPVAQVNLLESLDEVATPPEPPLKHESVKEEFEKITKWEVCTFGKVYYDPSFETYEPRGEALSGPFFGKSWITYLRRYKDAAVQYLVSQIPDKTRTKVHIDPFDMATKGELAVYCLQFILKTNWYDLSESYRTRYDAVNFEYTNDQALLRKIIGTKKGAADMMNLWKRLSERQS
jgi:hypothetical protein